MIEINCLQCAGEWFVDLKCQIYYVNFVASTFFSFTGCLTETFNKVGPPVCNETHTELMLQQIDKTVIDALNLICSDYQDSDQCNKYIAMFDKTEPIKKWKTPFPAIIGILESIA